MDLDGLKPFLAKRTLVTLEEARSFCTSTIKKANKVIKDYCSQNNIDLEGLCFVAVGSIGRYEALGASDLDLIPIAASNDGLKTFKPWDKKLREELRSKLDIKVSKGEDLTSCISKSELLDRESVGGEKDNSSSLTKRILLLTEGVQLAGGLKIEEIRKEIIQVYGDEERTSGRHILALCNDLSRYYRTLFIEYKAKVDIEDKDWGTRNAKLRHSRKVWFFSCMLTLVNMAFKDPSGENGFRDNLIHEFSLPPFVRLFNAVPDDHNLLVGKVLDHFCFFLRFMGKPENRERLSKIKHKTRYEDELSPFYPIKQNSDLLHKYLSDIVWSLPIYQRQKLLDWFLL